MSIKGRKKPKKVIIVVRERKKLTKKIMKNCNVLKMTLFDGEREKKLLQIIISLASTKLNLSTKQ